MLESATIASMNEDQLRQTLNDVLGQMASMQDQFAQRELALRQESDRRQLKIDQLTHEMALLRRWRFGASSERLDTAQASLFDDELDADVAGIEAELKSLQPGTDPRDKQTPKRAPLPAHLPRTEFVHEPQSTTCACGCAMRRIGQDVAEKLDYTPGVFTVHRHIRGKWACAACEKITMAPVPAHVIDKGIPTARLAAQVLVAKYADHLPLYRQEAIFGRAGLAIPRSTLAQWVGRCGVALQPLVDALRQALLSRGILHADETPVSMLMPGKGKTHRAYLWAYASTGFDEMKAVVYAFSPNRSGANARAWLNNWHGTLVVDDYTGYKALFGQGVTEAGCMAHARRKFHDLVVNGDSEVGQSALKWFAGLYEIERQASDLTPHDRHRLRTEQAAPIALALQAWLIEQRRLVPAGTQTSRAIDYSLRRWQALTRYLNDGNIPIDNNWIENRIRPIAIGRANWLFVGSQRAGERAAAVMTLVNSAKLNGIDPHAYLADVLDRLPTTKARDIEQLLPHRWAAQRGRHDG